MDALPAIVNEQWSLAPATPPRPEGLSAHMRSASVAITDSEQSAVQQAAVDYLDNLVPSLRREPTGGPLCAVHIVEEGAVCQRMNTLHSYLDVNRELANRPAAGACCAAASRLLVLQLSPCATPLPAALCCDLAAACGLAHAPCTGLAPWSPEPQRRT